MRWPRITPRAARLGAPVAAPRAPRTRPLGRVEPAAGCETFTFDPPASGLVEPDQGFNRRTNGIVETWISCRNCPGGQWASCCRHAEWRESNPMRPSLVPWN